MTEEMDAGREGEGPEAHGSGVTERWVHGAVILALFGAIAVVVRPVLSPFVLFALFLYVVWPRLGVSIYARLAVAATVLVALWVLAVTGFLLAPFILAAILAYVLSPLVDRLERWMPRQLAVAAFALPGLGVLALVAFVLMPAVADQVSQLIGNVPRYIDTFESWVGGLRAWLIGLDVAGLNEETVPQLREVDAQALVRYLQERQEELVDRGLDAVLGLGRGIGTALAVAGYLVLLPILTYYLLRDWARIRGWIKDQVPPRRREAVLGFAREYDRLLNRYLRGQLLLALCVGVIIGVGFWVVGFPYALLLGLLAGVLNVVPYVGLAASLVVALLIAFLSGDIVTSLMKVAGVFGAEQVIENVIGPKIVGESVGLHPVWVILALALFGFFFGFVGLLIAVPAAVLAKIAVEAAMGRYRTSAWYREGRLPGGQVSGEEG